MKEQKKFQKWGAFALAIIIIAGGALYIWKQQSSVVTNNSTILETSSDGILQYNKGEYSFEYPSNLVLNSINDQSSSQGVMLLSQDYQGEGKDTPTWDEVKSGFKIAITTVGVPEGWGGWTAWVERPSGSLGELVMREPNYQLGNRTVYKYVLEGNGFANEYLEKHTLTFFALPNESESEIAEIWLITNTTDSENYQSILEDIVKSFKWK